MVVVIKAVLFDLGGTLIRTAPVPTIFERILSNHGIKVKERVDEAFLGEVADEMPNDHGLPYRKFWRIYNGKILRKMGVSGNLDELADVISDEWWMNADLELYPDVEGILQEIRGRGLKLGLVTNGFRKDIEDIFQRVSLSNKFDVTVGVDDVGVGKPDRKIFLYALRKLSVNPEEALFVGDSVELDYRGAEECGLKPLLIDRANKVSGECRKIRNLEKVVNFL
jgi:putative hydrolase of the HAD superfamily